MRKPKVAISQGDPTGIGPEVILKALSAEGITDIFTPLVFAEKNLMKNLKESFGLDQMKMYFTDSLSNIKEGRVNLIDTTPSEESGASKPAYVAGEANAASGASALRALDAACAAVAEGAADVLVTAPIDKHAIQGDGFHFSGHTEYLADKFPETEPVLTPRSEKGMVPKEQMILFDDDLRVALLTTHLPIAEVAGSVKKDAVTEACRNFDLTLRRDFGCERPMLAVLALNPHAGDGGLLGDEEQREIIPAVKELTEEGMLVFGPYAADGFFGSGEWRKFDGILAMYHDQGLAPFKTIARAGGVNFTSGISIVRTSPDHGTAAAIAADHIADPTSMREAIYRAIDIWRARGKYTEISKNPLPMAKEKARLLPERRGNIKSTGPGTEIV